MALEGTTDGTDTSQDGHDTTAKDPTSNDVPRGWKPSVDTVAAITGLPPEVVAKSHPTLPRTPIPYELPAAYAAGLL